MDAFLLARLARELEEEWSGAWVQQAWQDAAGRLVLQLRRSGPQAATRFLLLSPVPGAQGLGTVADRPPVPPRPPALAAYLRAHAAGGRLESVRCPAFERVVELGIRGREGLSRVVLEATGRRGNLLALDPAGAVRSAWRWEPPETHPLRPLEPGRAYEPPPRPGALVSAEGVTREAWERLVASGAPPHRVVAGLGPALGRELAGRGWEAFRAVVAEYGRRGPVWAYPEGLSAIPVGVFGPGERRADALDAAGEWLCRMLETERVEAAGATAARREAERRRRLVRRLARLGLERAGLPDPADLRRQADALAAALSTVRKGDREARVPDLSAAGGLLTLALDPSLGPGENLERYYARARKAERAKSALEARTAETLAELEAGPSGEPDAGAAREGAREGPFRRFAASNGWPIWVGRNGRENDRLLREARPWDLWFHVRDAPGAHVLLRLPGREAKVPEAVLREAAALAAGYSRAAAEAAVDVMAVEAGRLRKPKGASAGRVLVAGERTIRVRPRTGG